MTHPLRGTAAGLARAAFLAMAAAVVASCSGGVTDPASNPAPTPQPLSVLPQTATLYSGLPTTFSITGGTAPYSLISSDQAAIPLSGSTSATSVTVIPGPVSADTEATLTVRDAAGTQAAAALTVKPRTISNLVTVTPSSTQAAVCGTAVCSGGDAEIRATLTQNGIPIANRDVRFDVISGDFRIITSAAGLPETTGLSGTTRTDASGTATIRIRALTDATAQTGILEITDLAGGNRQRASFSIYPVSAAPLSAAPSTIQFVGPNSASCATSGTADVIVFGGRAPYQVTQPGSYQVFPTTLTGSGQRFSVSATGACTPATPIAIVDANGASTSITVSNVVGTISVGAAPLVAAPEAVTLDSCSAVANIAIAGGLGSTRYFAASGNSAVTATVTAGAGRIQRTSGTGSAAAPLSSPVTVAFSDGREVDNVTVNLVGAGAGPCP